MKRYIVDGNVTDTRNVVGFAGERLFMDAAEVRASVERLLVAAESMRCALWCGQCTGKLDELMAGLKEMAK